MSIITSAKEFVKEKGKTEALSYYKNKLIEVGVLNSFEKVCKSAAIETQIDYIENNF